MKKVIIPFDGSHFSEGAFSMALNINNLQSLMLTGIFLPQVDYARFMFLPTAFMSPFFMPIRETFDEAEVEKNIESFINRCKENNIEYKVHKDLLDAAIPQLTKETRFADLMIIGSEVFYKDIESNDSFEYLKDTLQHAECPVLIVPEKANFPGSIVLTYDGSASSVYAIKQFANMFPELCGLKTILVYAGDDKHAIPDRENIDELAGRHFSDLTIDEIVSDHSSDFFNNWLNDHKNPLVVNGSFGRAGAVQLFNQKAISRIISEHQTPLFISHK